MVRRLRNNRSRGLSKIRSDHLKGWPEEANKAEAAAYEKAETDGYLEDGGTDTERYMGNKTVATGS